MKIEIQKTVTEEIDLPAYVKSGEIHFYKVLSDTRCVAVKTATFLNDYSISDQHTDLAFSGGYEPSTKEEFEKAFSQALEKLKAL